MNRETMQLETVTATMRLKEFEEAYELDVARVDTLSKLIGIEKSKEGDNEITKGA